MVGFDIVIIRMPRIVVKAMQFSQMTIFGLDLGMDCQCTYPRRNVGSCFVKHSLGDSAYNNTKGGFMNPVL
jgi:hypothetical protein